MAATRRRARVAGFSVVRTEDLVLVIDPPVQKEAILVMVAAVVVGGAMV